MINLIVSVGLNGVIGCDGELAHPIPEDLNRFRRLTSGCAVVMGRTTFANDLKSKPLPNRQNFILTRSSIESTHSKTLFINSFSGINTGLPIWVIGGSEIYDLLLPRVGEMYVTHIHKPLNGNRYFLPDWSRWQVKSIEDKGYFSWVNYTRK